jgi:adenosylcobinamide hydrolase
VSAPPAASTMSTPQPSRRGGLSHPPASAGGGLSQPPASATPSARVAVRGDALTVELPAAWRCLSSAVLGGGLGEIRSWLNLTVPSTYSRTDPKRHLRERSAALEPPVVGMMTAVDVAGHTSSAVGSARAIATVGVRHGLAAAGRRPRAVPSVGTINLLVMSGAPLTDAGLANALATAVEAKAQALAEVGVPALNASGAATGTATDSVCVACPPGSREPFAGPATRAGGDLARAVRAAVVEGAVGEAVPGGFVAEGAVAEAVPGGIPAEGALGEAFVPRSTG